jgi:predicted alpha-1,2-mannosidase
MHLTLGVMQLCQYWRAFRLIYGLNAPRALNGADDWLVRGGVDHVRSDGWWDIVMETFPLCPKVLFQMQIARVASALMTATFLLAGSQVNRAQNARFVDPMLGAAGGGNTFPGATLPYGMVKPGPDMGLNVELRLPEGDRRNNGNAGWMETGEINGFSQTHVSGTGGGCKYGNILVQPTLGEVQTLGYGSSRGGEVTSAGYYKVRLERYQIETEITAARRTAVYRFTYPKAGKRNLMFDVTHLLSSYEYQGEGQSIVSSAVHVVSPTEVGGSTTVTGGWNKQSTNYTVYFYAAVDAPAVSSGTWLGQSVVAGRPSVHGDSNQAAGAWFTFADMASREVTMKIGISFVSEAQARQAALTEVNGFDFDRTRAKALATWDTALAPIALRGVSDLDRTSFYTAVYHTMLMPVDRTGENPLWTSKEPYYDDFYTVWDTFRSSAPLLTLIAPDRAAGMVRALLDVYRHEGWLPDGRSGNFTGRTQGGSDSSFQITDAFLKKLPGIDWPTAYEAMVHDAEKTPADQILEGRGDLEDWKKLGYLSIEGIDRPVSKGMEYAANDYEVALLAHGLGRPEDYAKYLGRSQNWKNVWEDAASDEGFKGFVWARHRDGSYKVPFDPLVTGTWGSETFYEGNSWTYSTFVPQDVAGLIAKAGGSETFVKRMDAFFAGKDLYDVGNEPGFLAPYLYVWAGAQDRTADQIRRILAASYHPGPRGLPGNDDSGAMSSWYAFGKLGFYPNAGQDVYVIGSPAFPQAELTLGNGKTFRIVATGVSSAKRYIAKAEWNGKPWRKAWFTHEDLLAGGTLTLTMASTPQHWFTGDVPPSSSTER